MNERADRSNHLRELATRQAGTIALPVVESSEMAVEMLSRLGISMNEIKEGDVLQKLNQTIQFAQEYGPRALAASSATLKMMQANSQVEAGVVRRIATHAMSAQKPTEQPNRAVAVLPWTRGHLILSAQEKTKDTRLLQAERLHNQSLLPVLTLLDEIASRAEGAVTVTHEAGDQVQESLRGMPQIAEAARKSALKHDQKAIGFEKDYAQFSDEAYTAAVAHLGLISDDSDTDRHLTKMTSAVIDARRHRIAATEAVAKRDRARLGTVATAKNLEGLTLEEKNNILIAGSLTAAWMILQAGHDFSLVRLFCAISNEEYKRLSEVQLKAVEGIYRTAQKQFAEPETKLIN